MTQPTRRSVLAAATAALIAPAAHATAPIAPSQAPGFYRIKVGDTEVTILNDGATISPLGEGFVTNVSRDQALAAAGEAYMPPGKITVPYNPTLINTGRELVLIDTGNGPGAEGAVGHLIANLAAAGVQPGDIDRVVFSHFHPDHVNGLRRPDGSLNFPNAAIVVPAPEWSYWWDDDAMAKASDPRTKFNFTNNRRVFGGIEDRVGRYEWGTEVASGVTAIATPGHTPGHTSFVVASGASRIVVQSDVTNIPELFLRYPDWHVMFDQDADLAQTTRHKFYDMAAAEKMLVTGYHFAFPSAGHVEKVGTGYRLVPVAWNAAI